MEKTETERAEEAAERIDAFAVDDDGAEDAAPGMTSKGPPPLPPQLPVAADHSFDRVSVPPRPSVAPPPPRKPWVVPVVLAALLVVGVGAGLMVGGKLRASRTPAAPSAAPVDSTVIAVPTIEMN